MPIIKIDINTDEYFYDFDRRSKDANSTIDVSVTDEEYEQICKWRLAMNEYQKFLAEKHTEATELLKKFNELHEPPKQTTNITNTTAKAISAGNSLSKEMIAELKKAIDNELIYRNDYNSIYDEYASWSKSKKFLDKEDDS